MADMGAGCLSVGVCTQAETHSSRDMFALAAPHPLCICASMITPQCTSSGAKSHTKDVVECVPRQLAVVP